MFRFTAIPILIFFFTGGAPADELILVDVVADVSFPEESPFGGGPTWNGPQVAVLDNGGVVFGGVRANGHEIFFFDGISSTEFDLNPGERHSEISHITALGNWAYFTAKSSTNTIDLFRTNGSIVETIRGANDTPLAPNQIVRFNDRVFFSGESDGQRWLYSHDGRSLNQVEDINPSLFRIFGGDLYFSDDVLMRIRNGAGSEIERFSTNVNLALGTWWESEGTVVMPSAQHNNQSQIVRILGDDIVPLVVDSFRNSSIFSIASGDNVYFTARSAGDTKWTLWGVSPNHSLIEIKRDVDPRHVLQADGGVIVRVESSTDPPLFASIKNETSQLVPVEPEIQTIFGSFGGDVYVKNSDDGALYRTNDDELELIWNSDVDSLLWIGDQKLVATSTDGEAYFFDATFSNSEAYLLGGKAFDSRRNIYYALGRFGLRMLVNSNNSLRADFNRNGQIDVNDIDLLSRSIRFTDENNLSLDTNGDNTVDSMDLRVFVHEIAQTFFGDSNLDGEFNSRDLVATFQANEYEDDMEGNSTWATGDWTGDGEFTSGDLVLAFQDGGFEKGPKNNIANVPEPDSLISLVAIVITIASRVRIRAQ